MGWVTETGTLWSCDDCDNQEKTETAEKPKGWRIFQMSYAEMQGTPQDGVYGDEKIKVCCEKCTENVVSMLRKAFA